MSIGYEKVKVQNIVAVIIKIVHKVYLTSYFRVQITIGWIYIIQSVIFRERTGLIPKSDIENFKVKQNEKTAKKNESRGQNVYTRFTPGIKKPLQRFCKGLIFNVGVTRLELATP